MGLLCTAGRPTSPKVRGQRLAAVAAHDLRPDWPHKVDLGEGQRRWHHQLDRCLCGDREWMPAAERMDLWRASALQNAFSGASAHDDSAARAAEDNCICVRRQLRNMNYEVRFTRCGSFLICAEIRTKPKGAGLGSVSPRARELRQYMSIIIDSSGRCCRRYGTWH